MMNNRNQIQSIKEELKKKRKESYLEKPKKMKDIKKI